MKQSDVFEIEKIKNWEKATVVGIDIGSRQAKAVLLHNDEIYTTIIPTGFFMQNTAEELISSLINSSGIKRSDISFIVGTGYGRVALKFTDIPYRLLTEIACHGKGAYYLGKNIRTIIDIGGQDSKAIQINPDNGDVTNFAMNDKCAAGTGRFLEKIAGVLGLDVTEIGPTSLKADKDIHVDSTCVVFAESEVVSLRARGESVENIASGIHYAVAKRVTGLLAKVGVESNVLFTGGVSNNIGMKTAFEKLLGVTIEESKLNTVFAGALGAAAYAAEYARNDMGFLDNPVAEENLNQFKVNLESLRFEQKKADDEFNNHTTGKKAYVGYTCTYTPIEILASANVAYTRLFEKGTQEEITSGEVITQSMYCDHAKSIIGGFAKQNEKSNAVDKIFTFFTCGCMRAAIEGLNCFFVPTTIYNLPRKNTAESSIDFIKSEIQSFKNDLELLTGEEILDETIAANIKLFNRIRSKIQEIAEYRKKDNTLLSSSEFQEIMAGYFTIPAQIFDKELDKILLQLKSAPVVKSNKLRILVTGGIIAHGDTKITKLIEELGAEIVVEENCSGIKAVKIEVDESIEDVYEGLSKAYLDKAPCSRMNNSGDNVNETIKLVDEYDVDGSILYYIKFCPCFGMIEKRYTDRFHEKELPLLIMSGDYSTGDEGQIKTRLEAFLESIQQRKNKKD